MTPRRTAVVLFGAAVGVSVYVMTSWPAAVRAALTVVVLIVLMALFAPMWRQEDPPAGVEAEEAPKPTVVDRTRRGGDDDGIDVTK